MGFGCSWGIHEGGVGCYGLKVDVGGFMGSVPDGVRDDELERKHLCLEFCSGDVKGLVTRRERDVEEDF